MTFSIRPAVRQGVPMLISVAGVSGSGKTYSALLLAAGLAGDKGTVGFVDTENKRGSMYADSQGVMAALPSGYEIAEMKEPFTPARYSEAVDAFESHGCSVLVIDSMTHEWEGYGGCSDIAENNKLRGMPNWAKAKLEHKRMMNRLLAANMHIIFCLRARDKVKIMKDDKGKEVIAPIGLQPIQEKNFTFEMTLSMMLDEKTHLPIVTKCPEPLLPLFSSPQGLVTKEMGAKLREWSQSGVKPEIDTPALIAQANAYAQEGTKPYAEYWNSLPNKDRKVLLPHHESFKKRAEEADKEMEAHDAPLGSLMSRPNEAIDLFQY